MNSITITEDNLKQDVENGFSYNDMAKKYKVGNSTIAYYLKKWKIKTKNKNFKNGYDQQKILDPVSGFQVCNLCNENKSLNEYFYRKDRKVHHRTCKNCHNKKIHDKRYKDKEKPQIEGLRLNYKDLKDIIDIDEMSFYKIVKEQKDNYMNDSNKTASNFRFSKHIILPYITPQGIIVNTTKEKYDRAIKKLNKTENNNEVEEIEVNGVVIEDEDIDENVDGVSIRYSDWENDLAINKKQFYEILRDAKETHTSKNKFATRLHAKFPFKFSCGHTECCSYNKFTSQKNESERLCKACNNKKKQNQGITTMKTEENTEDYLKEIIDNNIIEFVLCPEGCAVDMRFKPINLEEDIWFPVQLKSSDNTTNTGFHLKRKYDTQYKYQLLLCHHLNKNNIFIFKPFSENMPKKTITISYESGNSKYLKFKLDNHNDLTNILLDFYYNPEYKVLLKSGETFDDMITEKNKLERKYEKIRLDTIRFMNFVRYRNRPHDFKVNDIVNVQEKTRNRDKRCVNSYKFNLSHGTSGNKPYDIGDNEFYWLNLAGTKIFYVIPEELLKKENKIRTLLSLHIMNMPPRDNYHDQLTYKFRFSYDTINQPEEKSRLLKMFEDKEREILLSLEMNNLEIGVEETKEEN